MTPPFLPPDWRERIQHKPKLPRQRWVRVLAWIWVVSTALTLAGFVAVALLLNNVRFHSYLIRLVESKASQSLGVPVHLQNFALNFHALSADLYGLTVEGATPYANPPLMQVDHAEASVRIVSILRHAWYLDDIRIDRPILHVFVDAHGVSNLPTLKSSGNSTTSVFDLGIRHTMLSRGEVYYNNQPSALAVDLRNVEFHSVFTNAEKKYLGELSYADGNVVYGAFSPVAHNFQAEFQATPNRFELTKSQLSIGQSHLNLTATLENYNSPSVQAHYAISLDGGELAKILKQASLPAGTIETSGTANYQQSAGRSLLDSLEVHGAIASPRLDVKTAAARGRIENVAGHYSLEHGDAVFNDLRANLLGGSVSAQGTLIDIAGNPHSNVKALVQGVSLAELTRTLGASAEKLNVAVTGRLNAQATATWGKTLDDLVAHADATIDSDVTGRAVLAAKLGEPDAAASAPAAVPVNSVLHTTYTAKNGQLAVADSYLRTPQTDLTMNGTVGRQSKLGIQLQARDLREVETIAELFMPQKPGQQPATGLGLMGTASFHGVVQGSTRTPHLTGQLTAQNLAIKGSTLKSLRTNVDVSPSFASLQNAVIEPATHGRITLNASTGLSQWSFTNTSPIQLKLEALQLNIADLTLLANQQIPVSGTVSAGLTMHGTELNPIGNGNVTLANVMAYQQPISSAKLSFSGDGQQVQADLSVHSAAGDVQGHATVQPQQRTYTASIDTNGIELEKLEALKMHNILVTGALKLSAKGQGSFDNPEAEASLQIPALVAQSQKITGLALNVNLADHVANATLSSSAVNTSIQARARVNLTGDYLADASLDTQSIPLQPLLAIYAPDDAADVTGQTELHATLHGPLKRKEQLEAHLTIPVFNVAYGKNIQMAAAAPIHADYKNGVVDVQRSAIRGTDTDLQFQGSIPTTGDGPMSLLLIGSVNLQLAQLFDSGIRSSGQLRFNIDSHGTTSDTDIGGEINIVDADFASEDLPVGLQHGNGVLKVTKNRVNIASFQATVSGGTVTAQGGIAYRPALQFDMGMAARGARLLYPQGMRESVDANVRLAGTPEFARLSGTVNLSDLSFTPAFDLDSFIAQFSGSVPTPPSQGFASNLQLNLTLNSTSNVNLVSRTLSIGGSANLQVKGTAAEPVLLGRVNLTDGDIILNGNRFVLNGGTIQFINPAETQPVVNLSLNTSIQQYSIDLRFNGPVDQLRTEYSSDPALPSADIINLLAFGQTTEASAASSASSTTNQQAESLVASQVSSQVTSRISKIAGISQLSISPVLAGSSSQGPPGAVITIQQRVTGNLFVNFSTNVASTQSQTIQGQYKVSPRVSFSATRDPNGGFGFDTLIKKSW